MKHAAALTLFLFAGIGSMILGCSPGTPGTTPLDPSTGSGGTAAVAPAHDGSTGDALSSPSPTGTTSTSTTTSTTTTPAGGDLAPTLTPANPRPCGTVKTVDFWAGQTIDAGSVTIYNDGANLYLTVYSEFGFQGGTEQVKAWVGKDLALLPANRNGTPIPGQFPWKLTVTSGTTATLTLPLSTLGLGTLGGETVYVVVHGDVLAAAAGKTPKAETAFGGDTAGAGPRWWFYTQYTTGVCSPTLGSRTETAFAKGTHVLTGDPKANPEGLPSLGLTPNRWGWAIQIRTTGSSSYPLWAAAGQNDTRKGVLAGRVQIEATATTATVTYLLDPGFTMDEVHVYAGDRKPATTAPGLFGYTATPTGSTHRAVFTVRDTDGDGIWIVAHAVVRF